MRIGIYHEPVHTDGRNFDTYGPFARYVLEFARHFDHVTVFAPTTGQPTYFSGCPLDAPNLTVAPLPFFMTHAQAYRQALTLRHIFRTHADSLDVLNCRGTAPLAYLLWWYTRERGVPFIYHFASDPFELIERSPKYRGWRRPIARTFYGTEFALQKYILRRNYGFASGAALARRLQRYTPNVECVVDSCLRDEDYRQRADCCQNPEIRLLYVGYLREGKGLDDLIAALALLCQAGRHIRLDLIGSGEKEPALAAQAAVAGVAEHVRFRGYVPMGPALNACYDEADIFVLPSLSEGSPRVVLEALGHSLPVVATDVGNIAEQLGGGRRGVLIPRRNPPALAAGIARLLDEPDFRRRCIAEGYQFARAHSLGAFVAQIARRATEMVRARANPATPTAIDRLPADKTN